MKQLPLGTQTFAKIVENDRLYVDKTKIVGINFVEEEVENEFFKYKVVEVR